MKKEWSLTEAFNGPDLYRAIVSSVFEEDGEIAMLKGTHDEIVATTNLSIERARKDVEGDFSILKIERSREKDAVIISYCEEKSLSGPKSRSTKVINTRHTFSILLKNLKVVAGNIKHKL